MDIYNSSLKILLNFNKFSTIFSEVGDIDNSFFIPNYQSEKKEIIEAAILKSFLSLKSIWDKNFLSAFVE